MAPYVIKSTVKLLPKKEPMIKIKYRNGMAEKISIIRWKVKSKIPAKYPCKPPIIVPIKISRNTSIRLKLSEIQ